MSPRSKGIYVIFLLLQMEILIGLFSEVNIKDIYKRESLDSI